MYPQRGTIQDVLDRDIWYFPKKVIWRHGDDETPFVRQNEISHVTVFSVYVNWEILTTCDVILLVTRIYSYTTRYRYIQHITHTHTTFTQVKYTQSLSYFLRQKQTVTSMRNKQDHAITSPGLLRGFEFSIKDLSIRIDNTYLRYPIVLS